MNEHGEKGWEPDASRGLADPTYGSEEERPTGANSNNKLHSNEPNRALELTFQTGIESKLTKAVNATHQARHSKHPENAHQSDLSTIATGFTSSSARLGILCRGTRVPKRFNLRRTHLCCCSPRTKGGSKGQSNPLLVGNASSDNGVEGGKRGRRSTSVKERK